jgi:hypothetical protein
MQVTWSGVNIRRNSLYPPDFDPLAAHLVKFTIRYGSSFPYRQGRGLACREGSHRCTAWKGEAHFNSRIWRVGHPSMDSSRMVAPRRSRPTDDDAILWERTTSFSRKGGVLQGHILLHWRPSQRQDTESPPDVLHLGPISSVVGRCVRCSNGSGSADEGHESVRDVVWI